MNTMNAMSKETNKTQAMLYLENKRKMAETGQTACEETFWGQLPYGVSGHQRAYSAGRIHVLCQAE